MQSDFENGKRNKMEEKRKVANSFISHVLCGFFFQV